MAKGDYLGEFEAMVLLTVARLHGNAYGLTIHDEIHGITGRDVSIPAVYVTLTRLEEKGYLRSRQGKSDTGSGRVKRFYKLSKTGSRVLQRSRDAMDRLWDGVVLDP